MTSVRFHLMNVRVQLLEKGCTHKMCKFMPTKSSTSNLPYRIESSVKIELENTLRIIPLQM